MRGLTHVRTATSFAASWRLLNTEQAESSIMRNSIFDDPLKGWSNRDILLDTGARDKLGQHNPRLLQVLDWPDIRTAFATHDKMANDAKRLSKRQGTIAVILVGLGIIALGSEPLVSAGRPQTFLHTIALSFLTLGGLLGVLDWLVLRARGRWLGHRFWTERLRQLYFQFLLQEHQLAARGLEDDESLHQLTAKRGVAFERFYRDPDDPRIQIREILGDTCDLSTWISSNWNSAPAMADPSTQTQIILDALREQRIGVQAEYTQKNMGEDVYSPAMRDKLLKIGADAAIIMTLLAAACSWTVIVSGVQIMSFDGREWLAFVAIASAVVLMLRALREGLKTEEEMVRYTNYRDGVARVSALYDRGDHAAKIDALVELERLSYVELRSFLLSQHAARFVAF